MRPVWRRLLACEAYFGSWLLVSQHSHSWGRRCWLPIVAPRQRNTGSAEHRTKLANREVFWGLIVTYRCQGLYLHTSFSNIQMCPQVRELQWVVPVWMSRCQLSEWTLFTNQTFLTCLQAVVSDNYHSNITVETYTTPLLLTKVPCGS